MFKQIINLIVCVLLFVFLSGCLVSKSKMAFGEYRPVENNETKEGRAQNRRIEIILIPIK